MMVRDHVDGPSPSPDYLKHIESGDMEDSDSERFTPDGLNPDKLILF